MLKLLLVVLNIIWLLQLIFQTARLAKMKHISIHYVSRVLGQVQEEVEVAAQARVVSQRFVLL